MRLIIAGGRNITRDQFNDAVKKSKFVLQALTEKGSVIISGGAGGVDSFGADFAKINNLLCNTYLAEWKNLYTDEPVSIALNKFGDYYNALAGHNRNMVMAKNATHLLLIWDGKSRGSNNMKETAMEFNLEFEEFVYAP